MRVLQLNSVSTSMPSFLSDLRRLSHGSFRTQKSHSSNSSGDAPSNKSSSTVNTAAGSSTPPSTLPSEKSSSTLPTIGSLAPPPILARPSAYPSQNSRYSIAVCSLALNPWITANTSWSSQGGSQLTLAKSPSPPRTQNPTSPYAPGLLSVSDNSWVSAAT